MLCALHRKQQLDPILRLFFLSFSRKLETPVSRFHDYMLRCFLIICLFFFLPLCFWFLVFFRHFYSKNLYNDKILVFSWHSQLIFQLIFPQIFIFQCSYISSARIICQVDQMEIRVRLVWSTLFNLIHWNLPTLPFEMFLSTICASI